MEMVSEMTGTAQVMRQSPSATAAAVRVLQLDSRSEHLDRDGRLSSRRAIAFMGFLSLLLWAVIIATAYLAIES